MARLSATIPANHIAWKRGRARVCLSLNVPSQEHSIQQSCQTFLTSSCLLLLLKYLGIPSKLCRSSLLTFPRRFYLQLSLIRFNLQILNLHHAFLTFAITAFAVSVSAQSVSQIAQCDALVAQIPSCVLPCDDAGFKAVCCTAEDYACHCTNGAKLATIIPSCLKNSTCSSTDLQSKLISPNNRDQLEPEHY